MGSTRSEDASRAEAAQRALAVASGAAVVVDLGIVVAANPAAAAALGAGSPDALVGRRFDDLGAGGPSSTHPVALGDALGSLVVLTSDPAGSGADAARIESELRLRESQRLAQVGSWELDLVGGRLAWSDEIYRIFELDPTRFGASYEAFLATVHPDDRARVDAAYRRSVEQRTPYAILHRLGMPDGRVKYVQERGRTFYDAAGKPLRSIGTVQDVTDRVKLEGELRVRDQAIAGSSLGVVVADVAGQLTSVNAAFLRMWGHGDAAEVLGRSALSFWAEPDRAAEALRTVLETGSAAGKLVARRRDGATFVAQYTASRVRREDGEPPGLLAWFADVTRQDETERALAARDAQLRQAQKLEALGRLASGVAHDFNNLLTIVAALGEHLAELVRDRPEAVELVTDILAAGDRAAELTRQLLTFARVGRSEPRTVDLHRQIRDFARLLEWTVGGAVRVELALDERPAPISIDPSQLEQVLLNLAINARDAMPAGGTLRLHTHPQDGAEGREVVLAATDTGHGMTDDVAARAFEPFFTTKEGAPGTSGTGLGLATVHGIVHQAKGRVWIESRVGQGTTLFVALPLHAGAPE